MDRLDSTTGPSAKETVGASGTNTLGCAKGLAYRSFGTHSESTPAKGPSDHELGGGVNGGHKQLTPTLQRGLAPLMGVACPPGGSARNGQGEAKGNPSRVPVRSEANFPACETLETTQGRVSARFPSFPDSWGVLPGIDVA
jgi:hypothetical protein